MKRDWTIPIMQATAIPVAAALLTLGLGLNWLRHPVRDLGGGADSLRLILFARLGVSGAGELRW